jgi:hypothetical protein
LTRQSISLREDFLQRGMDARVKPAHDQLRIWYYTPLSVRRGR